MATFEIEIGGKTYEVEAPDQGSALAAIRKMTGAGATQKPTASAPSAPVASTMDGMMPPDVQGMNAAPVGDITGDLRRLGRGADNAVRIMANGATFGMADRLAAGTPALFGSGKYSDNLSKEVAATKQAEAEIGKPAATALELAGGIGTGVGLAKSGVTLAGRVGDKILPRILGYGAEGAAYGAASEAGKSYGTGQEKVDAAMHGALWGGGVGAGLPIAGRLAGKSVELARSLMARPVDGATRGANLLAVQGASPEALAAFDKLGPQAMPADAAPSLLGLAQGAAAKPGVAKDQLVNALTARDAGVPQRLQATREATLGPRVIPSQVEGELQSARSALSPEYQQALAGAKAIDAAPLAGALEAEIINSRGPGQAALQRVRDMLDIPTNPGNLDPNPASLLNTRKAVDGMIGEAERAGNTDVVRQLSGARKMIDDEIAAKVPGIKAVDAKYADLSRQSESLERGQQVLDTGRSNFIRPEELQAELAKIAAPSGSTIGPSAAPIRMRQGLNAEVDRLVATGSDDLRAMENSLRKPANVEKIGVLTNEDSARKLANAVTAERKMRDTYNAVDRGSQTAQRSAANDAIAGKEMALPEQGGASGLAIRSVNKLLSALSSRSSDATRESLADILSKQGPEGRTILEALLSAKSNAQSAGRAFDQFVAYPGSLLGRASVAAALNRPNQDKRQ